MSLVIFGDAFTFPEGNAATNRVHTYAKGFLENGIKVHVICFGSTYNNEGDGIFQNISFYHPFGSRQRSKYFLVRRWHKILKYFTTIKLIKRIHSEERIIALNSWTNLLHTQLFIYILSRIMGIKVIQEHSEHPLRNYQGNPLRKLNGNIRSYIDTRLGNGIFCISQYLIDFYASKGVKKEKLFLVPSTVDTCRFLDGNSSPLPFKYILYCGSLTFRKDGVHILIESYKKIYERYPDIRLVLIGKGDSGKEENMIKELVEKLGLTNKVCFLGQLPRTAIPAYLKNATILALARPKSIVADAGFPSKLTEYLATGNPVVVTDVGEIPVYLKDNQNAFLSEPDNAESFSDKLRYVLDNYNTAKEIALKGKELTDTTFNYKVQTKRMIGFIHSLSN